MTNMVHNVTSALLEQQGGQILKYLSEHFNTLGSCDVKPSIEPGELAAQFAETASQHPKDFAQLMHDIEQKIMPGITHWQHPKFLSYYPASSSLPAILSEMIIASIGSVGLQWSANPIGTELECVVMDWILKMLYAEPESPFLHTSLKGGGLIQNTASEALVVIMTSARIHKHLQLRGVESMDALSANEQEDMYYQDSSRFVVYMSDQTHFSGPKAARVAGIRVRTITATLLDDGNYGIHVDQVKSAMEQDRNNGLIPCAVQLNYGSTNTCGYDDIASFEGFAEQEDIWLHVDAAYAGASLILPQCKQRSLTIQSIATSFNFNGSKWFLCGFDSAFLYVRDRRYLKDAFAASGDFMAPADSEQSHNPEFKDWAVPLGRRFRALRIWMVLEYFGVNGIQQFLQNAIDQADWLREKITQSEHFTQIVTTDLGLVCFSPNESEKTASLISHMQTPKDNEPGFLLYPSQINGTSFIRIAMGGTNTSLEDIQSFWQECERWAENID